MPIKAKADEIVRFVTEVPIYENRSGVIYCINDDLIRVMSIETFLGAADAVAKLAAELRARRCQPISLDEERRRRTG